MSGEKLWIHGKSGFQKLLRAIQRKTYGTWMRRECSGRLYLIVAFGKRGGSVMEARRAKTVAFFVSTAGTKEKPILIWKSETSRCLRKFHKSALPVDYFRQKKALMMGEIMDAVVTKLNRQLSWSNRSILLLMDNAILKT